MKKNKKVVLTIGGSDPSSGAGIQVDILTLLEHKVFPCSVVASVTSQNSSKITSTYHIPSSVLLNQLEVVFEDFDIKVVKIGMLGTLKNLDTVFNFFSSHPVILVIDPVLESTSGFPLVEQNMVNELKEKLFPLAKLITPNLSEASRFAGFKVENISDMKRAALILKETDPEWVLIKGGHLKGRKCVDVLYDGKSFREFLSEKLRVNMRGTGCIFSSAIAANLALGYDIFTSIDMAKSYLLKKLKTAHMPGCGRPQFSPNNPA